MLQNILIKSFPNLGATFAGQANRTVGYVSTGGSELGEAFHTLQRINEKFSTIPNFSQRTQIWFEEWQKTATYLEGKINSNDITNKQTLIRASEYYRQSAFFLRDDIKNSNWKYAYEKCYSCFDKAMQLPGGEWKGKEMNISLEGTDKMMFGRYLQSTVSKKSNICFILPGGYDSTISEMFQTGILALRRGHDAFIFDGPGQGLTLLQGGIPMKSDFETYLSHVLNTLEKIHDTEKKQYLLLGRSFGGYLVPRGMTLETNSKRIFAVIVDPGQLDVAEGLQRLGMEIVELVKEGAWKSIDKILQSSIESNKELEFYWKSRAVTHGLTSVGQLLCELQKYNSKGKLNHIVDCPFLIVDNPFDTRSTRGTSLFNELSNNTKRKMVQFEEFDGASDHCEVAASASFERIIFEFLNQIKKSEASL